MRSQASYELIKQLQQADQDLKAAMEREERQKELDAKIAEDEFRAHLDNLIGWTDKSYAMSFFKNTFAYSILASAQLGVRMAQTTDGLGLVHWSGYIAMFIIWLLLTIALNAAPSDKLCAKTVGKKDVYNDKIETYLLVPFFIAQVIPTLVYWAQLAYFSYVWRWNWPILFSIASFIGLIRYVRANNRRRRILKQQGDDTARILFETEE